jgi:acetyltransferase
VQAALRSQIPSQSATGNPVDITAGGGPQAFGAAARTLLEDDQTDALLAVLIQPPGTAGQDYLRALEAAMEFADHKPVIASFPAQPELWPRPPESPLAVIAEPESAGAILAAMRRRGEWLARGATPLVGLPAVATPHGVLDTYESLRLLKRCGIPTPSFALLRSEKELARAARRVGFPLALKTASPGIVHKTEAGGVALDIQNMRALVSAYRQMRKRLGGRALLQAMVEPDRELILGFRRDAQGTPMILAGLGGIFTEALDAAVVRILPVFLEDVREMLDELPAAAAILGPFRGRRALDRGILENALVRLAALGGACPDILELDINPFTAGVAVDVRVVAR